MCRLFLSLGDPKVKAGEEEEEDEEDENEENESDDSTTAIVKRGKLTEEEGKSEFVCTLRMC